MEVVLTHVNPGLLGVYLHIDVDCFKDIQQICILVEAKLCGTTNDKDSHSWGNIKDLRCCLHIY